MDEQTLRQKFKAWWAGAEHAYPIDRILAWESFKAGAEAAREINPWIDEEPSGETLPRGEHAVQVSASGKVIDSWSTDYGSVRDARWPDDYPGSTID